MKFYVLIAALALVGCSHKPPQKIITKTIIERAIIPDEFLICQKPPVVEDDVVDKTQFEAQYNNQLVLPLFDTGTECHQNMNRIIEWNEENKLKNSLEASEIPS